MLDVVKNLMAAEIVENLFVVDDANDLEWKDLDDEETLYYHCYIVDLNIKKLFFNSNIRICYRFLY